VAESTVSVALASYNAVANLGAQLQSLAEQSRLPDEVVISDDASQDGTVEIVRSFAERAPFPVRLEINAQRVGWKKNFVLAAGRCRGDVIAFCDQDDFWLSGKIERLATLADSEPWLALVHRNAFMSDADIDAGKVATGGIRSMPRSSVFYGGFDGHRMAFRRDLLPWLNLQSQFDDWLISGEIAHDRLVMLAALTVGRAIHLDTIFTLFRRHAGQVTSNVEQPSSASDYSHRASVIGNWIQGLGEAQRLGLATSEQSGAMIAVLARLAAAHESRAGLYAETTTLGRLRRIGGLVTCGSYAPKDAGALGARSLLKDINRAITGR
jgi:glycosyltransferase involved in cell wall biosynthesis